MVKAYAEYSSESFIKRQDLDKDIERSSRKRGHSLKGCKLRPLNFRSSHERHSIEVGALKIFIKFIGKHLCQNRFLNKVAGLRHAT